jgi:hypothetical protein
MRRLWQPCSRRPAADIPAGETKIRMVTYNILADKYSRCGRCSGMNILQQGNVGAVKQLEAHV